MPNLIVTYTRAAENRHPQAGWLPVEEGEAAQTELVEIGETSEAGALAATGSNFIVRVAAEADCWVSIGAAPVAEVGSGRKLFAGTWDQFACRPGSKVAVIADGEGTA